MVRSMTLVVFFLENQRYALHLSAVERIVRAAKITHVPKAPPVVRGIINFRGEILAVFNPRGRFHLAEREMELTDHLLIARTSKRLVALVTDAVLGVTEVPEERMVGTEMVLSDLEYVVGVVKLPDGLVLIHDLDTFLSPDEEQALDEALRETR